MHHTKGENGQTRIIHRHPNLQLLKYAANNVTLWLTKPILNTCAQRRLARLLKTLTTAEEVLDGLLHQGKVKTDALMALIDQIKLGLARDAGATIDTIGLCCGLAVRQQPFFMFVVADRGQSGHAGPGF